MAGGTETGRLDVKVLELGLESVEDVDPFNRVDRWVIVDQSEGCQAEVVYYQSCVINAASWILRVRADQCREGDLILIRKTEYKGSFDKPQESYHLCRVVNGLALQRLRELSNIDTSQPWSFRSISPGHQWYFNPENGAIIGGPVNRYQIQPGEWGYFKAMSEGWSAQQHFENACEVVGLSDCRSWFAFPSGEYSFTFHNLVNPLIKARQRAEALELHLGYIAELLAKLLVRTEEDSPLAALVKSHDAPTRRCAIQIVADLIAAAHAANIPLPDQHLTAKAK